MTSSLLAPFLFGTAVFLIAGVMVLYDPFRVGANIAQLAFSIFLASMLSWALWLTGNVIVISFFSLSVPAWEINVLVAMIVGPPIVRWAVRSFMLTDGSTMARNVSLSLAGALAGAALGRFVFADQFAVEYSTTGQLGTARVMWVWVGAVLGGHLYAFTIAVQNVVQRREP